MAKIKKIAIMAIVIFAAAVIVLFKQRQKAQPISEPAKEQSIAEKPNTVESLSEAEQLPRLVDLGAGKCVPCRMMEPILEELKHNYSDNFSVEFFDVWKNPDPGKEYGVRVIPTQIFYDAEGREIFRHEGFFSKEDILKTWQEHGIDIENGEKDN